MSWNSKNYDRMKSNTEGRDLSSPKQVWEDGEMTAVPSSRAIRADILGRAANARDLKDGNPPPHTLEIQTEVLSQTNEPTHPEAASPAGKTSAKR